MQPPADRAFAGRRVLVTGAASGIGLATVRRLAVAGAAVAGLDVDAEQLTDGMRGFGAAVVADVADAGAVERAVATAAEAMGGLDGLANVAGTGYLTGDVVATPPELWRRVLEVNLTGAYLVSRAAIGHMRPAAGGAIVHTSSQFALAGALASPAYCASKAGLLGLTRAMAVDHAGEGIRVNAVCPGPVDTPFAGMLRDPDLLARERERRESRLLIGRQGTAEEIAAAIAFLLSDDAASMTGSVLTVDGGWTAG